MLETKIIAFDERCEILALNGVPFEIYWLCGVAFFAFYCEEDLVAATEILGF